VEDPLFIVDGRPGGRHVGHDVYLPGALCDPVPGSVTEIDISAESDKKHLEDAA